MAQGTEWVSGGLVFLGTRQTDMTETAQRVAAILEASGTRVLGIRIMTAQTASLRTTDHEVGLTLHCDDGTTPAQGTAGCFLNVEIAPHPAAGAAGAMPVNILLVQVRRELHKAYAPMLLSASGDDSGLAAEGDTAEGTVKPQQEQHPAAPRSARLRRPARRRPATAAPTPEDFAQRQARLIRRIRHERAWDIAPEDQLSLRNAMRLPDPAGQDDPAETDRVRLSAWLLSIAVGLLCLPLGVALALVNMVRGENLRLASQTAALTGTFVALQAVGATAEATQMFQLIIGG